MLKSYVCSSSVRKLAQLSQIDLQTQINMVNHFLILGVLGGIFHFFPQSCIDYSVSKQWRP